MNVSNNRELLIPYKQALGSNFRYATDKEKMKSNIQEIYKSANLLYDQGMLHEAGKLFSYLTSYTPAALRLIDQNEYVDSSQKVSKIYHTLLLDLAKEDESVGQFAKTLIESPIPPSFGSKTYFNFVSMYRDFVSKTEQSKCIRGIIHPLHASLQNSSINEKWNYSEGQIQVDWESVQGERPYQEDRILIDEYFQFVQHDQIFNGKIYAVFDGHGGSGAAQFLLDRFSIALEEELSSAADTSDLSISNALSSVFVTTHYILKQVGETSGSTACLAFFFNNCIYVANCGDSRMVLGMDGEEYQLTRDDDLNKKDDSNTEKTQENLEKEKLFLEIYERGGKIESNRVGSYLAMAKAIGDINIAGINPRPVIHKIVPRELPQPKKASLIIGSDGLWVIKNKPAVVGIESVEVNPAEKLCDLALKKDPQDNISAIVINLIPQKVDNQNTHEKSDSSETQKPNLNPYRRHGRKELPGPLNAQDLIDNIKIFTQHYSRGLISLEKIQRALKSPYKWQQGQSLYDLSFFQKMMPLLEKLSSEDLVTLLSDKGLFEPYPLHNAEILKEAIPLLTKLSPEQRFILLSMRYDGKTPLEINAEATVALLNQISKEEWIPLFNVERVSKILVSWPKHIYPLFENLTKDELKVFLLKIAGGDETVLWYSLGGAISLLKKLSADDLKEFLWVKNKYGDTLLHAPFNVSSLINLLQNYSLSEQIELLSVFDDKGRTPFHIKELIEAFIPCVKELPSENVIAYLSLKDSKGKTPLDDPQIVKILKKNKVFDLLPSKDLKLISSQLI